MMHNIFSIKSRGNSEEDRVARILNTIILAVLFGLLITFFERLMNGSHRLVIAIGSAEILILLSYYFLKKGKTNIASTLLLWTILVLLIYLTFTGLGLRDLALFAIPGLLMIASLVSNTRYFTVIMITTLLAVGMVGYCDINGYFINKDTRSTNYLDLMDLLVIFSITAITLQLVSKNMINSIIGAKKNETVALLSEAKFRSLVSSMQDLVYTLDDNLKVTGLFGQWSEVYGITEDIIGRGFEILLPFDERVKYISACNAALGGQAMRYEWHLETDGSKLYYFESSLTPFYNEKNKTHGIVCVARDISERKKMESDLLLSKKEAEEADKLKSSLLANMSHEIRTPLNGILGYSRLLYDELTNTEHQDMIYKVEKSAKRLLNTLNSVITLTELENNSFSVHERAIDIDFIIRSIKATFESVAREKGIQLIIPNLSSPLTIKSDDDLLFKSLWYIVDNAIKYTDTGSVKISAAIDVNDKKVSITVTDTGIGIKDEDLDKIFIEFRQISEGFRRNYEGLGVGLAISNTIIKLLGGTITVKSIPAKGTAFTVELPYIHDAEPHYKAEPVREHFIATDVKNTPASDRPRFLIVEDNTINAEVIEMFVSKIAETTKAFTGESALALTNENNYDLFLLDIHLGEGINGIELLHELRSMERFRNTPAIALTGFANSKSRKEFVDNGFSSYLAKPFEKAQLLDIISQVLRDKK